MNADTTKKTLANVPCLSVLVKQAAAFKAMELLYSKPAKQNESSSVILFNSTSIQCSKGQHE